MEPYNKYQLTETTKLLKLKLPNIATGESKEI